MKSSHAILIMINNYFHDLATALLFTSAVGMAGLDRAGRDCHPEETRAVCRTQFRFYSRLSLLSLAWILVGGIPRTLFFRRLEWSDAAGKGIIPALLVKHLVMSVLVWQGYTIWKRLAGRLEK